MKIAKLIFLFVFCVVSAQQNLRFDSLKLKDTRDFFADDYGNIYLYKNKNFSFNKYDSVGLQKGQLMLTLPFKIQSVQNPLTIPTFSENAQELKFFDQNLNEIQTLNFRQKFGFIKHIYAEDLQQIWLLDESTKRLIQYNFRDDRIINSYPFFIDFENILDFIVFENQFYVLTKNEFSIYNFKTEKLKSTINQNGKRLRRENQNILVIAKDTISVWKDSTLEPIFKAENAQIVDKNSTTNFVIKDNKLYLYPIQKEPSKN